MGCHMLMKFKRGRWRDEARRCHVSRTKAAPDLINTSPTRTCITWYRMTMCLLLHLTSALMALAASLGMSPHRMGSPTPEITIVFGKDEQLGIWLIGRDSIFCVRLPSTLRLYSSSAPFWCILFLGMQWLCCHPKRGPNCFLTYGRMANRNLAVRPNYGGFVGSSSSLSSTSPIAPSPRHSPWSCTVEWYDNHGNSLGFSPRPIPNDLSSSHPHVHPAMPPSQPPSTPPASSNHCEDCLRLLDTVLILHNLLFELQHDMADLQFKLDLMNRRGESMASFLRTLFTPEARPVEAISEMMGAVEVILMWDTTPPPGQQR